MGQKIITFSIEASSNSCRVIPSTVQQIFAKPSFQGALQGSSPNIKLQAWKLAAKCRPQVLANDLSLNSARRPIAPSSSPPSPTRRQHPRTIPSSTSQQAFSLSRTPHMISIRTLNCGVCFLRTQLTRIKFHLAKLCEIASVSVEQGRPVVDTLFPCLDVVLADHYRLDLQCDWLTWLSTSCDALGPLLIRELRLLPTLFIMQERQIYTCSKIKISI